MDKVEFLKNFETQFDDLQQGSVTLETELDSIDEWGSLQALSIIAMLDNIYKVNITSAQINGAKTIGDIFLLASNIK